MIAVGIILMAAFVIGAFALVLTYAHAPIVPGGDER